MINTTEYLLNPRYKSSNFVTGNFNSFAYAACIAVAEKSGKVYNPLFIYGKEGTGKTHLLNATAHIALNVNKDVKLKYITTEMFTNEFIEAIKNRKTSELRDEYIALDILLLDDIEFLKSKQGIQEEIVHIFNNLYNSGKQIVIASDRLPKEIETLPEKLSSRLSSGLVVEIKAPDLEAKKAIIKRKIEIENTYMPEDVIEYIAKLAGSNIRELEGLIVRVLAYSSLNNEEISLSLAEKAMEDLILNRMYKEKNQKKDTLIEEEDIIDELLDDRRKNRPDDSWWHIYRVWNMARFIAAQEQNIDLFIVEIVSILHDMCDSNSCDNNIGDKKRIGNLLSIYDVQEEVITRVCEIISAMACKGARIDSTEGKIVKDADELDELGATGIARAFTNSRISNRAIYNPEEKSNYYRPKDGNVKINTIDRIREKSFLKREYFYTDTARRIAEERIKFMKDYTGRFLAEWEGVL